MNVLNLDGQAAACYDSFARLLIDNKAAIGMEDISNAELFTQAPAILSSLVRISIGALRAPDKQKIIAPTARPLRAMRQKHSFLTLEFL